MKRQTKIEKMEHEKSIMLQVLTPREYFVLTARQGGCKYREIAQHLGIGVARAGQIAAEAQARADKAIKNGGPCAGQIADRKFRMVRQQKPKIEPDEVTP